MKDSEIEWMGNIPEGWDVKKIGTLIQIQSSGISLIHSTPESFICEYCFNPSNPPSPWKFLFGDFLSLNRFLLKILEVCIHKILE